MTNYFTDLLAVECQTDKKSSLTYISWIEAWAKLKQQHPGASYEVHRTEGGRFLHGEGFVMVSVTVPDAMLAGDEPAVFADVTHTMWLPVMDHRNNAIENPNPTQINKALMRCLAKCVAMHGLGAYVYMGEDLPTVEAPPDYGQMLSDLRGWADAPAERSAASVENARRRVSEWPQPYRADAEAALDSLARSLA